MKWTGGYETKERPSVVFHLQEVARQARTARPVDADDGNYSPANKNKSARNLVMKTYRGTVVDFGLHLLHRNLVSSKDRSKTITSETTDCGR